MPHQDYLRRLIDDEGKYSPPASSGGRGASPDDFKPRYSHLGNRALAALAIDFSVSSSDESNQPSADDTPSAVCTPPAPPFTSNSPPPPPFRWNPPPPRAQEELAGTLQKLRNAKALNIGLPAYSEAKRCSSGASRSSGCLPPNKIANFHYAGHATTVASSIDDGLLVKPIMLGGPAHNIGLNRQSYNIGLKRHSHNIGLATSPNTEGTIEGSECTERIHELELGIDIQLDHDEHRPRSRYDVPVSPSVVAAVMPDAAAELSGQSQLAPPEKSSATLVCLLTGSLFCTKRDDNVCHIIRGFWEYEDSNQCGAECESFQALGSNRFELYRKISSDIEMPPLTEGGIFNGSFAHKSAQKEGRGERFVFDESGVMISFAKQDEETQSYALTGIGRNQVGEFRLIGKVLRTTSGDSYNLLCRKEYTELFQSQPNLDVIRNEYTTLLSTNQDQTGQESRKKMKLSTTKKQSSIGSGYQEGNSSIIRPPPDIRAVADRTALLVSKNGRAFAKNILNSGKGGTPKFEFSCNTSPFHAYYEDRIRFYDEGGTDEQEPRKQNERETAQMRVMNVAPMSVATFTSPGNSIAAHAVDSSDDKSESSVEVDSSASLPALLRETAHRNKQQRNISGVITSPQANVFPTTSDSFNDIGASAAQRHPKAVEDAIEETKANDMQEAFYGMDGITNEDLVQSDQNDNQPEQVPLETILGSHWASVLESQCGLETANELYDANGDEVITRLIGVVGPEFQDYRDEEVKLLTKGLLFGWYKQLEEVLHLDESKSEAPPTAQRDDTDSIQPSLPECYSKFTTPLSYAELQFIKSQGIKSDAELSQTYPSLLAHRYAIYLDENYKQISFEDSLEVTTRWRQRARLALGMISSDAWDNLPQINRLAKISGQQEIMHTVSSLSKTSQDEENGGLPRRTIFTLDARNNVLYEFLITVGDSTCPDDAGKGAFLTFKGAKLLKASSEWKKRDHIPQRKTRKPLEASFSNTCGACVTLKGYNLHGDEHNFGPEHDDSIGLYREYRLDDFVDTHDNITFSSNHEGCGLIELESRYAPLIPADRKTDLVFSVKDFIFSNEPSSWRYDVTEKLHGEPQVVDFTDDTTGAPHDIAKSHMSMYVNEVGHNMDLIENVESLSQTPRSVTYYIHLTKPVVKGDKVELLTNYKEQYESMRERKGYGKSNLLDGTKSDSDDVARVRRNLDDRFLLEKSILTYSEDDIFQVIKFFHGRVWCAVEAATSANQASSKEDESNLLRQCIARRRLDWVCRRLRIRFFDLQQDPLFLRSSDVFVEGMYIFVHDWPNVKTIPRPPYTGLATIRSITKDKHGRIVFEAETLDKKYIEAVPEAVVTHPTDDDFKGVPSRVYSSWKKWKRQEELPGERLRVLDVLDTFKWNLPSSFLETLTSKIFESLKWEFAEEILFLLAKEKRLTHPFDEMTWCPFSSSLLEECVLMTADFLLMGREKLTLYQKLTETTSNAFKALKEIINNSAITPPSIDIGVINKTICVGNLALKHKVHSAVLIVESIHINELCVEDYLRAPRPLDLDWYLINQIILPIHAVASVIDWDGTCYSLETLFEHIELDIDAYAEFFRRKVHGWHPLIEM